MRKSFDAEFRSKVSLDAIREEKILAELSSQSAFTVLTK